MTISAALTKITWLAIGAFLGALVQGDKQITFAAWMSLLVIICIALRIGMVVGARAAKEKGA